MEQRALLIFLILSLGCFGALWTNWRLHNNILDLLGPLINSSDLRLPSSALTASSFKLITSRPPSEIGVNGEVRVICGDCSEDAHEALLEKPNPSDP
ncbi:hypothetical protein CRG98_022631 [Punica granatum]|uniref:Uncharacterized protein n=1 Tax=Punica granatum TaxID=22663 RepID=A0A2I0JL55_PUNGR|nr:hypothetical protein CRG98_022631 [Punica granatum]